MHPVDRTLANMFQVLGRLFLLDMQPDEDMFKDLLWICGRYRKAAEAKEIFAIMRRLGCPPTQATYVEGCCWCGCGCASCRVLWRPVSLRLTVCMQMSDC
jgi:hypothetical protein